MVAVIATLGTLRVEIDPASVEFVDSQHVKFRVLDQVDEHGTEFIDCEAVAPITCLPPDFAAAITGRVN